MLCSSIDHIVVTAPSLAVGVEYVRQTLGATLQIGGEHPRMGTHNCLLKIGARCYLEVIAINPYAPRPDRPRWFGLDKPAAAESVCLATWLARTDDIYAAVNASPIALGEIEAMSRGEMNWLISITSDGSVPLQGIVPALIQWPAGVHPAVNLEESGCSLVRLEGFHQEADKVADMLDAIGFEGDFAITKLQPGQEPYLVAHIQTPSGLRQLKSADFP